MTEFKKIWIKPVLVAFNPSVIASGTMAQVGFEGVIFNAASGCGVYAKVTGTLPGPVAFKTCYSSGSSTCTNLTLQLAASDTNFFGTVAGLCS